MNLLQAATKDLGVFFSPIPYTDNPASRIRVARRVKSLSEDTRQKPSTVPPWSRSMASMIIAESVEFFPVVNRNC